MAVEKKRSSNLELYRIICMFMIVCHHFVVNSGLMNIDGPMHNNPESVNTIFLYLFGMWGKTGINCFLMITGYFMCTSNITIRKFVKLMIWIYFYHFIFYGIFLTTGYETMGFGRLIKLLMPVWGFNSNFTSCFIGFWLTIPFWNILIHNMTQKQHQILLVFLVGMYSILGNIPGFIISFNYVSWFGVIYVVASYIRLYPKPIYDRTGLWAVLSLCIIVCAMFSVVLLHYTGFSSEFSLVSDSNKLIALAVAVTTFILFKNIKMPYNKIINAIGASTFGVLLIHANSNAMRQWLWKDVVDCVGHFNLSLMHLVAFCFGTVALIFSICIIIDRIRVYGVEKPFFKWYDNKFSR